MYFPYYVHKVLNILNHLNYSIVNHYSSKVSQSSFVLAAHNSLQSLRLITRPITDKTMSNNKMIYNSKTSSNSKTMINSNTASNSKTISNNKTINNSKMIDINKTGKPRA